MPGTLVTLGPFKGGLATASDPSSIADNELAACDNWDLDFDGSLINRPPITLDTQGPVSNQNIDLLGYFVDSNTGTSYLLGSTDNAVHYLSGGTWTQITTGFRAAAATQFLDKMWIVAVPGSGSNGGSWVPTGGAGTFTTVASMPKGMGIVVYKDRLWIAAGSLESTNGSRLYFSAIADGSTWNGSDFIDVNKGDGQKLIDLYSYSNNLFLFKEDSTYVFSYDSAPTKGTIQPVSKVIGVSDIRCVAQFQTAIYVYHEGSIFELVNYNYSQLDITVNLQADTSLSTSYFRPVAVSIVNNRLVIRYFEKIYVFNLKLRAWTTWTSAFEPGAWFQVPQSPGSNQPPSFVSSSCILNSREVYDLFDGIDVNKSESFNCYIKTKIYDIDAPGMFKKLYWWGIDVIAQGTVVVSVTPVVYSVSVTWNDVSTFTWNQVAVNTWDQPLVLNLAVTENIGVSGSNVRKFLKAVKAIRFRSVFFEVTLPTTGTTSTSPVKLFKVVPSLAMKEKVVKMVS